MSHSSCDRSPVRQLRSLYLHSWHCSDPVGTCGTLCGRALRCSPLCCLFLVLLQLQNPRQAWAQPSNVVRTMTRARPPPAGPSASRQLRHRGQYPQQQSSRCPQESPGCQRDLRKAKELPKMTVMPDATLCSVLPTATLHCSSRIRGRTTTSVYSSCM